MGNEYFVSGQVIDKRNKKGLSGLLVEAWDRDRVRHDFLGHDKTDEKGQFTITFDDRYFAERFGDIYPDLFFRVYADKRLVLDTIRDTQDNIKPGKTNVTLEVHSDNALIWKEIRIDSFKELMEFEKEIIGRIQKMPNGGNLFMTHPFLCLKDVQVIISANAKKEIIAIEPSLKGLSEMPYLALKRSRCPQKITFNVLGLFQRRVVT